MPEIEWILFLAQIPANPSSLRVKIWRKLRDAGSTSLQHGVWILPRNGENTIFLQRLLAYIKQSGSGGQIFLVQRLDQAVHEDIIGRFNADRDEEYAEFLEQCEAYLSELEKESLHLKFTYAELEENEQSLHRLRKWLAKIQKRDFFKSKKSLDAVLTFQNCHRRLQSYTLQVYTQEGVDSFSDVDTLAHDSKLSELDETDGRE